MQLQQRIMRFFLAVTFVTSLFSLPATAELTIGSPAPELDIEHWVQDGEGKFKPITSFENGKVYVVEFWATWCGPCVRSMPHLAEMQTEYADQGLQLISVSNEPLDTVTSFLERKVVGDASKTYAELTRVYCLTTDPDRSVSNDYMRAAGQRGIPTSFLVGKDGRVEWIGHPMSLKDPLEQVLHDKWDRASFKAIYDANKKIESLLETAHIAANGGDFKKAREVVDKVFKDFAPDVIESKKAELEYFRKVFTVYGGLDDAVAVLKKDVEKAGSKWLGLGEVGSTVAQAIQINENLPEDLRKQYLNIGIGCIEKAIAEKPDNPSLGKIYAFLLFKNGDLDKALEIQTKVVEASKGRSQLQAKKLLEQIQAAKEDAAPNL